MNVQIEPRILAAERMANSVFIEFDDGKRAVFSASLLHNTLPQAEPIPEYPDDSEPED